MTGSLARALWLAWRSPTGRAAAITFLIMALVALLGPFFLPDPGLIPDDIP